MEPWLFCLQFPYQRILFVGPTVLSESKRRKIMKKMNRQPRFFSAIVAVAFLLSVTVLALAQEDVNGKYQVGQRVQCEFPERSGQFRVGTIINVNGAGSKLTCCRYRVRFDDEEPLWREEGRLCAERSIKLLSETKPTKTDTPAAGNPVTTGQDESKACPFNKDFKIVTNSAPPSAELFKGVIFAWEFDLNKRFRDFGLTFLEFKMAAPFKNRVYPGVNIRRDVDTARPGTTIYPLKLKQLKCQKDVSITIRRIEEIEYTCYKDEFGEWVCKNGAPKLIEHTSFDNQ
jgi:hypothetical protein